MARNYSDEQVEAIFRRALERQLEEEDGFEHDELIAAAREVGLSDEAIDKAVDEIESERGDESILARLTKKQRERWLSHLVTYLVIAGGFLGMHVLGYVGAWAIWMAFGWGMAVALDTFSVLRGPSEEAVQKEKKKLNRKARRRAQAEARREAKRRKAIEKTQRQKTRERRRGAGDEIERVIEEGVSLLLSAAANKLREATADLEKPPQTEFEHYVASKKSVADKKSGKKKKSEPRGVMVTPPPDRKKKKKAPRARVEVDDEDDHEEERASRRRRGRSRR